MPETDQNSIDRHRNVKLQCRNVWKVYGPRPDYYFDAKGYRIEPELLAARLTAEGHLPALIDASFDVHEGEIFVIMGLSGSGKSTLVRCLSRLIDANHGTIQLDGQDLLAATPRELIEIRRHKMGMVFQSFGLLPHLTVLENTAFPLKLQGMGLAEREARAREMIRLVGLDGREASYPSQLSGGQQQRVGIARSLAVGPDLWFLDEPFSALDPLIRRQMQDEFLRLQDQLKKTIVFITHDIMEACRLADRIALMRNGRIIQIGTPAEILLSPADEYVAEFTAEVALARVIRAGDLAVAAPMSEATAEISADQPLEALMSKIGAGHRHFRVLPAGRYPGGYVAADRILAVLGHEAATLAEVG
ncbi:quaternary amine ABC transporter ATP-binding protein [Tabrizicola oligotrophica]|uniref:Quaternary amine transport ATP-binding protein n=1 Tax=Tabrizicola oligotrophica TaxID=2710650 RepID=A0A6M0QWG4_9RHOB|nr:betaine/proline/choline family ABC transporter ATP-binding protein [Tabrizicola oligotrophica]NEY91789.1 betaine/proline/choline family ABC transporter ATP-binding protein [Tabrizicola oligotrophica]